LLDILRGEWTDPRLSKTTVAEWSERWYRTKSSLKPKTLAGYDSNLRVHVLSAFGDYELRHIDRMAVEEWVADLQAFGLGPSAVRQARQVLNSMMKLAVEAGYLLVNPVTGVAAPRQDDREMLFLSAEEVERLAAAIRPPYATLVYLLAYGGLRWGEAVALRRKRCHLLRSRVEVAESLADARGQLHFGTTKTHQRRMVVIPGFLHDLLAAHLAAQVSDDPEALVFTSPEGQPLRNSNFRRRIWHQATADAGLAERSQNPRLETHLCVPAHHPGSAPQSHSDASGALVDIGDDGPLRAPVSLRHRSSGSRPRCGSESCSCGPNADQRRIRGHRARSAIGETPYAIRRFGGAGYRSRTDDLLITNQLLYH